MSIKRVVAGAIIIFVLALAVWVFRYFQNHQPTDTEQSTGDKTSPAIITDEPQKVYTPDEAVALGQGDERVLVEAQYIGCRVGGCRLGEMQMLDDKRFEDIFRPIMDRPFKKIILSGVIKTRPCANRMYCGEGDQTLFTDPRIVSIEFLCESRGGRSLLEDPEVPPGGVRTWLCELPDGTTVPEYRLVQTP